MQESPRILGALGQKLRTMTIYFYHTSAGVLSSFFGGLLSIRGHRCFPRTMADSPPRNSDPSAKSVIMRSMI